jgi:tetratricopeptide (TPR) repeat protein
LKAKGEFALVIGSLEQALEQAGQPVNAGTMAHLHGVYMGIVDTAAEARDLETLRKYTPTLEELARRDGHRLYLAVARRAWGVAWRLSGEREEAEANFSQALETFRAYGARWQIGRTLAELGELAQAGGNITSARDCYTQALAEFEALRAAPAAARMRELVAHL